MNFNGRCLGLGPSYASPLEVGEVELICDDETITMRLATGVGIETVFEVPRGSLIEMSADEIEKEYTPGHTTDLTGILAWRIADTRYRLFLLADLPGYEDTARVVVLGMLGESEFGPAFLFTPERVNYHEPAIALYQNLAGVPNGVPRLADGGRLITR